MFNAAITEVVGDQRLPDAKLDGERAKALWGQSSFKMEQLIRLFRSAADIIVATVPSAKTTLDGGGVAIAPDLYGRMAQACIGCFDFAGYLTARMIEAGKVERKVSFAPRADVLNRQRLVHPVMTDIVIPEGGGGWKAIKEAFQKGLGQGGKSAQS